MSFSDIFKSSFLENVTAVSLPDMLIALALSFGVGLFIFLIYGTSDLIRTTIKAPDVG